MIDLSTNYLGLKLKNPIVASSSPLCEHVDTIRAMEDAGASAIVLSSLFEEQIELESRELDRSLSSGTESFAESLSYFPDMTTFRIGPEGYLGLIQKAKAAVAIPIIASLNGKSKGGWTEYAKKMEQAGADAIELNIYHLPTDPDVTGAQIEESYEDLVREVKSSVRIPVAVKLSYYFSAVANMAKRLDQAGADALVIFNRFYQPDFDLDKLEVTPNLVLSNPYELRLRLHWVAILHGQIKADLAITGGVHTALDVLKAMMAGAQVAMMTSAVLKNGIDHITKVRAHLLHWMEENEYESIEQMQGSMSYQHVDQTMAFERGNYMKVLSSYTLRSGAMR